MAWEIYVDGDLVDAQLDKIVDELDGIVYAYFFLANNAENRDLVSTDRSVVIKYDGTTIFEGTLTGAKYEVNILRCIAYDSVYYDMDGKTHTGSYSSTAASTILSNICTDAGVTAGECPSDALSIKFTDTDCWVAARFLAYALNKDYWTSDGTTFNIGDKGSDQGEFTPTAIGRREIDRAKSYNKVIVKGYDADGNEIEASASTDAGDRVKVFFERHATDVTTLGNIASKKLSELNASSIGNKITLDLEDAVSLSSGDTITVEDEVRGLSGSYKIERITKYPHKVDVELEVKEKSVMDYLREEFSDLDKLGIEVTYPNLDNIPDGTSSKKPRLVSSLPSASDYEGVYVYVTSGDDAGRTYYSDGSRWIPQHPEISYKFKYHIRITGESLDGWSVDQTVTANIGELEFDTGVDPDHVTSASITSSDTIVNNNRNPSFKCRLLPDYDTDQTIRIAIYNAASPFDQWGFIIDGSTIYAFQDVNSTRYQTSVGTITAGTEVILEGRYEYGTSIKYYVDDSLVHTETTNLPGAGDASIEIYLSGKIINNQRTMSLYYFDLFQEWS